MAGFGQNKALKEAENMGTGIKSPMGNNILSDMFLIPPFSVIDTKRGYWQDRKRTWMHLGIQSELGRGDDVLFKSKNIADMHCYYKKKDPEYGKKNKNGKCMGTFGSEYGRKEITGTSVFDPVLCELIYTWFTPKGATVLDPFAGGSVRGVIASRLERDYVGVELSESQVIANKVQLKNMIKIGLVDNNYPRWINDDSRNIDTIFENEPKADLIFSCPPYADLEVYSDDPRDLSNKPYAEFLEMYREIIKKSCDQLADNRFACFVVSEVRSKSGEYYSFVSDTIKAFQDAGLRYYNEMILVNVAGTLPVRSKKPFKAARKVGRCHQNILIFVKGDEKKATQFCGDVEIYIPKELTD